MLMGNGAFSLAQWARIAVLAKLASAALVGEYALALALANPVFMLANLQLSAVQATDARDRYEFSDFAMLRLLSSAAALAVVAALVFGLDSSPAMRLPDARAGPWPGRRCALRHLRRAAAEA
jgi:hypothetical protein